MLKIKNDTGLSLQLPADQKLTVEINSTIFDTDDVMQGSYSYQFTFGLNENNCRFIGNSHLPEMPVTPDMAVVVSSGPFVFQATLTYSTAGNYANANLLVDMGELADTIRNVSLREYITETLTVAVVENLGTEASVSLLELATATPGHYPVVFPPFLNPEQVAPDWLPLDTSGNEITTYRRPKIMNYFNPLLGTYSIATLAGSRLYVPMVYVSWLLNYLCNKLGFSAQGSFFSDSELSRAILFNTQTTTAVVVENQQITVEVARHLPDITISEFFKAIRSYIGMSIDVNTVSRTITFNTYKEIKKRTEALDITTGLVPSSVSIEKAGESGYTVVTKVFDTDDAIKEELITTSYTVATSEKEIALDIGTCRMAYGASIIPDTDMVYITENLYNLPDFIFHPYPNRWLIPYVSEPGNVGDLYFEKCETYSPYSDAFYAEKVPELKNAFGLRMLIYRGMMEDNLNNLYPFASSVSYDAQYRVFSSLSLQSGEPDDIWVRYQKQYYEFLAYSRQLTIACRLTLSQLSDITPSKLLSLQMNNLVKERYILEKLTYELPATNGIVLAEVAMRQAVPKLIRGQVPYDDIIVGYWVQLVLENKTDIVDGIPFVPNAQYQNNAMRYVKADVVMYVWQDGLYQIPAPDNNLIVNYKLTRMEIDATETPKTVIDSLQLPTLAARTVLHSNYTLLTARFKNHLVDNMIERIWLLLQEHTFNVVPGDGYRRK